MTANAEIVTAPPAPAAPLAISSRATIMKASIEADMEQRALLKEYIKLNMVEGTDYGTIPGTPKPTLYKPGAEKLCDLYRCEPDIQITDRVQDWDKGFFHYEFKYTLKARDTGYVHAVGVGSCNTREGRYRWRKAERTCPDCKQPAILKSKFDDGGYYCYGKKGGCGAKFADGDPAIEDQPTGKVENDDVFTFVNTVLKMAKKRAHVDAAIALARCSDMFTQDVEDMQHDDEPPARRAAPSERSAPRETQRAAPKQETPSDPEDYVIPLGKSKGKKLREMGDEALVWFAENIKHPAFKAAAGDALEKRIQKQARAFDEATKGSYLDGAPSAQGEEVSP